VFVAQWGEYLQIDDWWYALPPTVLAFNRRLSYADRDHPHRIVPFTFTLAKEALTSLFIAGQLCAGQVRPLAAIKAHSDQWRATYESLS